MKRIIAFFLLLITAFVFTSCTNEKSVINCYSCGKTVSKADAFCSSCGVSILSSEKKESSSQSEPEAHTHTYTQKITAPTCTNKGYTTYVCSCGDSYEDDYKDASHSFTNYFCTECKAFDREHSHDYLISWLKENAYKGNGSYAIGFTDDDTTYALMYEIDNDAVLVLMYSKENDWFFTMHLSDADKNFDYSYRSGKSEIKGKVNAKTFTRETVVDCDEFYGLSSGKEIMKEMASTTVRMAVHFLKLEIANYSMDVTIADLGFENYK